MYVFQRISSRALPVISYLQDIYLNANVDGKLRVLYAQNTGL